MEGSDNITERDHLWNAAQKIDESLIGEEYSKLGARALNMFYENNVHDILVLGCGKDGDVHTFTRKRFCITTIDFSSFETDESGKGKEKGGIISCGAFLSKNIREKLPSSRSSIDAIFSKLLLCVDIREDEIMDLMWECLRVLRPGGLNILSVFSDHDPACGAAVTCGQDEWISDRGFVSHFFNEEKIRRIAKGFMVLWIQDYVEEKPSGSKLMYEIVLMKPKRSRL